MARALNLIGASRLATLEQALHAALQPWCGAWGVPADAVTVRAAARAPVPAQGADAAWLAALRDCLFPDAGAAALYVAPALLAPRLAEQADAALGALLAALDPDPPAAGAASAAALEIGLQAGCRHVRLSAAAFDTLAPRAARRGPALAALDLGSVTADAGVVLEVDAGTTEIPLGALAALRIGDVLRLDSRLDDPLTVRIRGGAAIAQAYLGRSGERAAIEIVTKPSTGVV